MTRWPWLSESPVSTLYPSPHSCPNKTLETTQAASQVNSAQDDLEGFCNFGQILFLNLTPHSVYAPCQDCQVVMALTTRVSPSPLYGQEPAHTCTSDCISDFPSPSSLPAPRPHSWLCPWDSWHDPRMPGGRGGENCVAKAKVKVKSLSHV